MLCQLPITLVLATIVALTHADCHQMPNEGTSNNLGQVETDTDLCVPQGAGQWTFSLSLSTSEVPVPPGKRDGITEDADAWLIYDESCVLKGEYQPPACGSPATIEENFLTQVLTVDKYDLDIGGAYYSFTYGDGKYSINNNHCDCVKAVSYPSGGQKCKCAFPVDGHFTGKRALEDLQPSRFFRA